MAKLAALILWAAATPVLANPDTGQARVIDGDTLALAGVKHRLHGIDAPERKQMCEADGQPWTCGKTATQALIHEINNRPVTCQSTKRDRYKRQISVCFAGGTNLNAWMVRHGWALAYRKYSKDYVGEEAKAKAEGRGIWAGRFTPPWVWRKGKK